MKSKQKVADIWKEFQRFVSVSKLWRHLNMMEGDNVGALPMNMLFEEVSDEQAKDEQ